MSLPWTTLRVLDWMAGRFQRAGVESARLEAQILLAHSLDCDRVALYTSHDRPLAKEELAAIRQLIQRRLDGESVAYLVGEKEFWSRSFMVDSRVLVPRADTEVIIEAVRDRAALLPEGAIVDVGTGCGAIAITLALEIPERSLYAIDISSDALEVARKNAERLGASAVTFLEGALLHPLEGKAVAAIVANLPYVCTGEIDQLDPEVRCEPRTALDGGADGLDLIRELIRSAPSHLSVGGMVFLEHGMEQGQAVRDIAGATGELESIETLRDLGDRDRVTIAVRAR